NGPEVKNKGFALFPRMVNGQYAMLSRQDNENVYLMYSDQPYFWYSKARGPADVSVGVRAVGQLRVADRDGGGVAGADPRGRPDAAVRDGGVPARPGRPGAADRAAGGPAPGAGRERAGGVCAERGVQLGGSSTAAT
ncbi:MAG TPA: hypothetical protein VH092_35115, partial [Urbifossiella sp.]|nr:hypothetical protein [Urbifossiella sp.]